MLQGQHLVVKNNDIDAAQWYIDPRRFRGPEGKMNDVVNVHDAVSL